MNKDYWDNVDIGALPSLQEIASAGVVDPWKCPACGCKDWRVRDSRQFGMEPRKRERECRNCGHPLQTFEIPVPQGKKLRIVLDDDTA